MVAQIFQNFYIKKDVRNIVNIPNVSLILNIIIYRLNDLMMIRNEFEVKVDSPTSLIKCQFHVILYCHGQISV